MNTQNEGVAYAVVGEAQVLTDAPVANGCMVTVYRDTNGALWARPVRATRDEPLLEGA